MPKDINKIVLPKEVISRIYSYLANDGVCRIEGIGELTVKVYEGKMMFDLPKKQFQKKDIMHVYFRPFVKMKRLLRNSFSTS